MKKKRLFLFTKKCIAVFATLVMVVCLGSDLSPKTKVFDFAVPLVAEAYSSGNYKVSTSSGVNVRGGPGTTYAVKGAATNGTQFSVVEINGNWGKTKSIKCTNGTKEGWVCLSYCTFVSSNSSGSGASSGSSGKTGNGVVYNCSALNVRTEPSSSGGSKTVKTSIKCGTAVYISSTSGNWGYDTIHAGYVSLSYINFSGGGGGTSKNYISLGSGREYMFEPMCAPGKVIDVKSWGKSNGTNVQIWTRGSKQANQIFKPVDLGNGYYAFMDKNSGKALDVSGGSAYNGANIIVHDYHGGANQQWRIIYTGKSNGHCYYSIQSKINSNYYLDVNGANNFNGCNLQLYKGNGTSAQKFVLYYYSVGGNTSNNTNNNANNNSTGGHRSFKPLQQSNYKYALCGCGSTISGAGCGPMSTVNAVGYLTGKQMDISTVASTVKSKGLHCCGVGCYHSVTQSLAASLGSTYGYKVTDDYAFGSKNINGNGGYPTSSQYSAVWSDLVAHLKRGEVAVTLVHGHFIAIVAYDSSTNKVLVYDSAAASNRGTTTNGDWKSYNELDCNSSAGYQKLKLRAHITFLARK